MSDILRPQQLILIRHAESERNLIKRGVAYFADDEARRTVRGTPDNKVVLTPAGILQAQKTGVYLRDRFGLPDYIYHSGYQRTIQTKGRILEAFTQEEIERIDVRMNQFIRERDPGYAYDMTVDEAEAAFPWLKEHWTTFGGFFARPPGGESISDVTQRVYMFLNTLFRDRAGKKIWVVTHGGTIRAFRFIFEHWTYEQALKRPEDQPVENCGITVYNYSAEEKRLVLGEYNTVGWR